MGILTDLAEIISWACIILGSFFCIVGGIGLLRLPDFFSRMHGAGITDTLGAGLIIAGLMFQSGLSLVTAKLFMIVFFLYLTSPTSTHSVAKAARMAGLEPLLDKKDSES
jgi:multicomponent Na+:H+ antiporter subunit G